MTETANKYSTIIIDDEALGRDVVRHMLKTHPMFSVVKECSNGIEAIEAIQSHDIALIFLDIKMPGLTGLDVAETLQFPNAPFIVFVTAYHQYAIEAFEQNAIDYLLKPFDQKRFDQMIERVTLRMKERNNAVLVDRMKRFLIALPPHGQEEVKEVRNGKIVIKDQGKICFVDHDDIEYIEASGNYVILYTLERKYMVYDSLSHILEALPPEHFLRFHRSIVVNTTKIQELEPSMNGEYVVFLKGGGRVKLSRTYVANVKSRLGIT